MTELEELTARTKYRLQECVTIAYAIEIAEDAIQSAYALGKSHATSESRKAASRANGAKAKAANTVFRGGRKVGSKDKGERKPGRWAHKTNETNETEMKP